MSELTYGGYRVIESPHLTVKRTWWERLFSLPWRPLATHKPSNNFVVSDTLNVILAHPVMVAELRKQMGRPAPSGEGGHKNPTRLKDGTRFHNEREEG